MNERKGAAQPVASRQPPIIPFCYIRSLSTILGCKSAEKFTTYINSHVLSSENSSQNRKIKYYSFLWKKHHGNKPTKSIPKCCIFSHVTSFTYVYSTVLARWMEV
jgi:hypothetical protein